MAPPNRIKHLFEDPEPQPSAQTYVLVLSGRYVADLLNGWADHLRTERLAGLEPATEHLTKLIWQTFSQYVDDKEG